MIEIILHYLPLANFLLGGGFLWALVKFCQKVWRRMRANEMGTQALLRDRLYSIYYKYKNLGYRSQHGTDDFENLWAQYHNLGANGVMDNVHELFLKLELREVD